MAQAQPPLFPLPEPPADAVAQLLDLLRAAKRELEDAKRIRYLLQLPVASYGSPRSVREGIELDVAQRRVELWRAEVATVERTARALGIDVTSAL
jgi:hypothetical protein